MYDYAASWLQHRLSAELQTDVRVDIRREMQWRGVSLYVAVVLLGEIRYGYTKGFTELEWEQIVTPESQVDPNEMLPDPFGTGPSLEDIAQEVAGELRTAVRGIARNPEVQQLRDKVDGLANGLASTDRVMRSADAGLQTQVNDLRERNRKPWWRRLRRG